MTQTSTCHHSQARVLTCGSYNATKLPPGYATSPRRRSLASPGTSTAAAVTDKAADPAPGATAAAAASGPEAAPAPAPAPAPGAGVDAAAGAAAGAAGAEEPGTGRAVQPLCIPKDHAAAPATLLAPTDTKHGDTRTSEAMENAASGGTPTPGGTKLARKS